MNLKLQTKSRMLYAFLMALFSVLGFGQGNENFSNIPTASGSSYNSRSWSGTDNVTWTATAARTDQTINGKAICTNGAGSVKSPVYSGGMGVLTFSYVRAFTSTNARTIQVWVNGVKQGADISVVTNSNTVQNYSATINITGNVELELRTSGAQIIIDDISWSGYVPSTAAPSVTASSFTGNVGSSFSQQIVATDNPSSYAVASGSSLPSGLNLNTVTGEISGTPVAVGNYTTNVTATNSFGTSAPTSISFTINKGNQTIVGFVDQNKYLSSSTFTLPSNTDVANLPVTYSSSNLSVVTVSGNVFTITGMGTATITATQGGDANWNSLNQQILLTVSPDPYSGVGRFEKISSMADLTDGYYVITDRNNQVMATNAITNGTLVTTVLNAVNNVVINPSTDNVWNIVNNNGTYTIQNTGDTKFLGYVSSTSLSTVNTISDNKQRWNISYDNAGFYSVVNVDDASRILKYNADLSTKGFKAYTSSSQLPEVALYKWVESTTWNGSGWSNGNPDSKDAIITGSYSTTVNPAFTAKNITVKNGGILEITSGNTVSGVDVTVEDGGHLIQRDGSTLNYSGAFKVLKNGTSEVNKYAFWSSPVASQNLSNIYGNGNTPQFITEYNTATDYFVNAVSTTSVFAKGYSIKTPVTNANLIFEGAPNNGTQTFTLATAGNGFNLVGNPYPSSLDLDAFYNANSARISNTFYFWDNKSNSVTTQGGVSTTNIGYATYNPLSSAWVPAPNISAVPSGNVANIGQGFIVQTLNGSVDPSLTFNNDMRGNTNGSFFNKTTNNTNEGKFWLRLNSSYNTSNTFAVAYLNAASDSYDNYDSRAIALGSDAFYTLADAQKLVIQGKGSFDNNDVVAVGAKHFENGNFTVSLVQKEGLFDNGQAIYLHDKVTGVYTDLQNNAYSFAANAGEMTDRFEIVYKLNVLSTSEAQKDAFEVYRDGEDFFVRNNKNIEKIEIFDASGRKIQDINAQSKLVRIQLESKGVYIIKAISEGKEYTKKLIK